ncbi:Thermosome subunit alpha [uncultured archaeon]|nr:Thermosome subunit alpha [uncultured archaeon]
MTQQPQQQFIILPENMMRTRGRDAQGQNILAARVMAEIVKTTLGPRGMDKMLVDSTGDVTITNDGATIVESINVEHPAAKMVVEVAKTQDEEVGDGTTTAVMLVGELLTNAEKLLEQSIHPTVIVRGYRMAAQKAQDIIDSVGKPITLKDTALLMEIAGTSMTGKSAEAQKEILSDLTVKAVRQVAEEANGKVKVDRDTIAIEKKAGGSIADSELINGVVLDKERATPGMPKKAADAKIALVDSPFEIKKTETDAKIRITSTDQLLAFGEQEEKILKDKVDAIVKSGANVLFCQKGIDDIALHYLTKAGILTVKNVSGDDIKKLSKATGATIASNLKALTAKDLGYAKTVEEIKIGGDEMIFVRDCKNPKAVAILARGGTEHVVDEIDRSLKDAVGSVATAVEAGKVVAGGGSIEIEVAREIRKYAETIGGREQLAVQEFADALESIPKQLAKSAGMDTIDTLVKLRAEHEKKGGQTIGVNVFKAETADMWQIGVIEPTRTKINALRSATEASVLILRIDDVIASGKKGGGGAPGME